MTLQMLKGKIHRATVTQADLNYTGSITIDETLLKAAGILAYAGYDAQEAVSHKPAVVFADEKNHVSQITSYEKHGLLKDME